MLFAHNNASPSTTEIDVLGVKIKKKEWLLHVSLVRVSEQV